MPKRELEKTLSFGYLTIKGAKATWGARTIVTKRGYDMLNDRQGLKGHPVYTEELIEHLNSGVLSKTYAEFIQLQENFEIDGNKAEEFTLYEDDKVVVLGNTNGSCGYFYLSASLIK